MLIKVARELVLVYLLTGVGIQRLHEFNYELLMNDAFFFLHEKKAAKNQNRIIRKGQPK